MAQLCDNCGATLPNAAGSGLYCTNCGEPIIRRRQKGTKAWQPSGQMPTIDAKSLSEWVEVARSMFHAPVELHFTQQHYELRCGDMDPLRLVVRHALADYNAAERLSVASEDLWLLEDEIDGVRWHMTAVPEGEEPRPTAHDYRKLAKLILELEPAMRELEIATMIYRDQFGIRDYSNQRG